MSKRLKPISRLLRISSSCLPIGIISLFMAESLPEKSVGVLAAAADAALETRSTVGSTAKSSAESSESPGHADKIDSRTNGTAKQATDGSLQNQALPQTQAGQKMLEAKYGSLDEYRKALRDASPPSPGPSVKLIGNIEEKNLMIEWNEWHNRFSHAVRNHMFSSVFETINFPRGLLTAYSCDVSSEREIKNIKIAKSSGNFWFDSAVVKALRKLDGSELLAFPAGSKRSFVTTEVGVRFGTGRSGELEFHDVEYRDTSTEDHEAPSATPGNERGAPLTTPHGGR